MFYVYVLYSEKFDKYYIGHTNNLDARIIRHNNGREEYTKKYVPWMLKLSIRKNTRAEAVQLEKKLKNLSRERILHFIDKCS